MKTMKDPAISENGTPSLSADAPGGEETDQDQWDKSGETPERNVLRNFHAAVFGKSGEVGNDAAEGRSQRHRHPHESGN